MKTTCLLCRRNSADNNLFCQERYCPAEQSPRIFEYGDTIGDIEIYRVVSILRSSVLYEAYHHGTRVLLKMAHPGDANTERLKREVALLAKEFKNTPGLPRLLPPYGSAPGGQMYGRATWQGQLCYYAVFAYVSGETLRHLLAESPQLWVYHIGRVATHLAACVSVLQSQEIIHGGISPECVLVSIDPKTEQPNVLLCDLGAATTTRTLKQHWYRAAALPAYTAPELIERDDLPQASYATDVYGAGLVFYEMLNGKPAFPFAQSSDSDVYDAVCEDIRTPMSRAGDVREMATIAIKASHRNPSERYPHAAELARELTTLFPLQQRRRTAPQLTPRLVLALIGVLITLALVATIGINLLVTS